MWSYYISRISVSFKYVFTLMCSLPYGNAQLCTGEFFIWVKSRSLLWTLTGKWTPRSAQGRLRPLWAGPAEPQGQGYNQWEGGGEPGQLVPESRAGGEKATLSKSSPKLPHQNTLRKEGITQKNRDAQGKQPSMCSVFLQARLCRRLITDLVIRLRKKLLSHPLLLIHDQEPQALHEPHNVSKKFLMNLFGT